MGLGLWGNEKQSQHEAVISEHILSVIAAKDMNCSPEDITVLGYFDIPKDHPDRKIGDTIYVQAFQLEYPFAFDADDIWKAFHNNECWAIYGITDEGKVHLWAN